MPRPSGCCGASARTCARSSRRRPRASSRTDRVCHPCEQQLHRRIEHETLALTQHIGVRARCAAHAACCLLYGDGVSCAAHAVASHSSTMRCIVVIQSCLHSAEGLLCNGQCCVTSVRCHSLSLRAAQLHFPTLRVASVRVHSMLHRMACLSHSIESGTSSSCGSCWSARAA